MRKIPKYMALHGFSDASEQAYGVCVYLRSEDSAGNITVRLVTSKLRLEISNFSESKNIQ